MHIRPYNTEDESQVIALWGATVADAAPHNDPALAIRLKMKKDPQLFLVAVVDGTVVGTVMGGFDGHRGWIYSLAVNNAHRRRGIAASLVRNLEDKLREMGMFISLASSNCVGLYIFRLNYIPISIS